MSSAPLLEVIKAQKQGVARGITSICSANTAVLEASFAHAKANDLPLLIESTCNQVNQYGGYTGQTAEQFMAMLLQMAAKQGFPRERLVVGGDHLGPNPWRDERAQQAMDKSRVLVEAYVKAGYTKIHLDASMKCADDAAYDGHVQPLPTEVIAARTAELARVAEETFKESGKPEDVPLYIIGTEVPAPGGVDDAEEGAPQVTSAQSVEETISTTRDAFLAHGLAAAWERVIGVVVQPGVEYGNDSLYAYDPTEAAPLSHFIKSVGGLVFEAHSTDYQTKESLHELVRDQFAILKVGPALTFAFREAVFALAEIEEIWLGGRKNVSLSKIREMVDEEMVDNPKYWRPYYPGDERQQWVARQFSLSDRIRYYWPVTAVKRSLELLLANLSAAPIPLPLLSQYLPQQYLAVRESQLANDPAHLIEHKIKSVLDDYAFACEES